MTESNSDQSLDQIWADDLIGDRQQHAEFLHRYLTSLGTPTNAKRGFVLNIDAEWGSGKSYFMSRLQQHLAKNGHLVAFVDAWRDDFANDPLVAVLHAVRVAFETESTSDAVRTQFNNLAKKGLKIAGLVGAGFLRRQAFRLIGDTVNEIFDVDDVMTIKGKEPASKRQIEQDDDVAGVIEAAFDSVGKVGQAEESSFRHTKAIIEEFVQSLRTLATTVEKDRELTAPIFILIDEVDRCRPTYAIELLERVKHIFEAAGVIFIIATDTEQLSHSVKSVYGEGFDGRKYLQRFFDQTYILPAPVGVDMVRYELERLQIDEGDFLDIPARTLSQQIEDVFSAFNVRPRLAKRSLLVFSGAVRTRPFPEKIFAPYLIILSVAHCSANSELWDALTPENIGTSASRKFSEYKKDNNVNFPKIKSSTGLGQKNIEWSIDQMINHILSRMNRNLLGGDFGGNNSHEFTVEGFVADLFYREVARSRQNQNQQQATFTRYYDCIRAAGVLSSPSTE